MKRSRSGYILMMAGVLALPLACDDDDDGNGNGDYDMEEDACAIVEGQTYLSQDELDCGLNPGGDGAATCHWRVEFDDGEYEWRYSDLIRQGTYSCDGATIIGDGSVDGETHQGTLDLDTGELRWEGVLYEPET